MRASAPAARPCAEAVAPRPRPTWAAHLRTARPLAPLARAHTRTHTHALPTAAEAGQQEAGDRPQGQEPHAAARGGGALHRRPRAEQQRGGGQRGAAQQQGPRALAAGCGPGRAARGGGGAAAGSRRRPTRQLRQRESPAVRPALQPAAAAARPQRGPRVPTPRRRRQNAQATGATRWRTPRRRASWSPQT